ncbi:citrate synthase/methylcitrate synthase [Alicyclobacillus fastidiosus]|uniref:Citrate synthase n=1 Tax=Alicyclobacillus fastidiosus TaxID=392011 RepID=A0ABY6ZNM5_9BACL|nr:citrate/2-methylcitrate synthase [Alicyclobacillus fastidiosus]WAH43776.1 citrate synthase/methylcitrate synthase [Alicyclobacillus fastidiosus]GMA59998.1 citrate synthase 1 [Alicyclobacillus fastidiosus]
MAWVNGLQDVVAAGTELSEVNGEVGKLSYRGRAVADLVGHFDYEDVAYLLWYGEMPSAEQKTSLNELFFCGRQAASEVFDVIDHLPPSLDAMNAAAIGLLCMRAQSSDESDARTPAWYTAAFPVLLLRHHANQHGLAKARPDIRAGHVATYLYLLRGGLMPTREEVQALEAYMILTMEHSLNASAFAGRVAASTRANTARALVAALMTMTGPLHGGAPSLVLDMFDAIGSPARVDEWLEQELASGRRLMGFGHRVYRTVDPRAKALYNIAANSLAGQDSLVLAQAVERRAVELLAAAKPGRRLHPNVEYWAACVLRSLDIPHSLFTATFATSRMAGWCAHILEQRQCDKLIRPQAVYVSTR